MTDKIMTDKTLMRVKDAIVIVGAVYTLLAFFPRTTARLEILEKSGEKYAPMVERHETQLAVMDQQYKQIMASLDDIKRELKRR